MLVEFYLKLVYPPMCGKNVQIYGVHVPRKRFESRHFYSCTPSQLKTLPEVQKPVSPTAERGGGNYDLLYQNSIRKYEDD